MSVAVRLPLVYATAAAARQARDVLPEGASLENICTTLIGDGRCIRLNKRNLLVLGDGWRAEARRIPSPLGSGRGCWEIHAVGKAREAKS